MKTIKKLIMIKFFVAIFIFNPANVFSTDFPFNQTFTVFQVKSETVATTPSNLSRTTLGIGEEVNLSTDPVTTVSWSVTGGGSVSQTSGSSTKFTASKSPSNPTIRASVGSKVIELQFNIIAPNGMTASVSSNNGLGTPGPPNRQIGCATSFSCVVTPTTVSFYNIEFRENIPRDTWTWPDGTSQSNGPKIVPWRVTQANGTTDSVSGPLVPISRISNGTNYVNFTFTIRVPEDYKNEAGSWIEWLGTEEHDREFRGSDQKARASLKATNTVYGSWQGPWQ